MFNKLFHRKNGYAIKDMAPLAVAFVAVAIALGMGLTVLDEMGAGLDCNSGYTWNSTTSRCENATGSWVSGAGETYATNTTRDGIEAAAELAGWLPTIALIVAAAIIIGIIVVYLAGRFR